MGPPVLTGNQQHQKEKDMKYVCEVCGWEYDPAEGDSEGGIAPGTAFADLPADWACPVCGAGKDQFTAA
jgi:rubredoxin